MSIFNPLFGFNSAVNALRCMNQSIEPQVKTEKAKEVNKMNAVYDQNQEKQALAPLLAKGGEGVIYPLEQLNHIVVKLYFDEKLEKNAQLLQDKVNAMTAMCASFKNNMAWPAILVFDEHQKWIGYAMPKMEGRTFRSLAHPMLYKKYAPNLNRCDIANMMLSWLEGIEKLHKSGVMIGDYNLQNFMWNPENLSVSFIDCDSYQIKTKDKFFPCLVGSPDLTAPEQHGRDFKTLERTVESEYFSINIILFLCFMIGRHPYDIVAGEDPVKNLQNGNFAYGRGNNGKRNIPKGSWYKIWSHLPYAMKELFITTFTKGVKDPSKRATIKQWKQVLRQYLIEIEKGYHNIQLIPDEIKSSQRAGI